jgi:hypothetical protein
MRTDQNEGRQLPIIDVAFDSLRERFHRLSVSAEDDRAPARRKAISR